MSNVLFVGNLAYDVTAPELGEMFHAKAPVVEVRIVAKDRIPQGYAFVTMRDEDAAERILEEQSRRPYFPKNGCWPSVKNQFTFHLIKEGEPFEVDGVLVNTKKMKHPGNSYAFSFEEDGKKFIYATDAELEQGDYDRSIKKNFFFENADVLVLDSQYTGEEALVKANWGHNIFCYAVDFANTWHVKNLYLFHHEPTYSDKKIHSVLQAARWYEDYTALKGVKINLAVEGQEIEI